MRAKPRDWTDDDLRQVEATIGRRRNMGAVTKLARKLRRSISSVSEKRSEMKAQATRRR